MINRDELLKMAREAGILDGDFHSAEYFCVKYLDKKLEEFANAILERAAVECDKRAKAVLEHEQKIAKESGFTPAWERVRSARTTSQRCANSIRALKTQGE